MTVSIVPALRALKVPALVVLVGLIGVAFGYWLDVTFFPGTSPEQPIAFSHRVHAGDNEIPCQYCHVNARRSIAAGVPSVEKCMNCHQAVATERPQIRKLTRYWENREPIPWIKVHDLPDFVYFPHKRHVQADIQCQQCHGIVQTMDKISQVAPLKMGWCLTCHDQHEVEFGRDCWTCHK